MGLEETETPFLKGAHRLSCTLGLRAKLRFHRNLGQTWLQFFKNLLGKQGVTVAHCGGRAVEAKLLGIFISMCFSGDGHFGKIWPHPSALRNPRPNNNPDGITASPISKQDSQAPLISPRDKAPPTRGIGISPTYKWAGTSPSHHKAYSKPYTNLRHKGGRHQK